MALTWNGVAAILTNSSDQVLLQHRSKDAKFFPDRWSVFTGAVTENDKDPEQAVRRELGAKLHVKYADGNQPFSPHNLQPFRKYRFNNYGVADGEASKQDCVQYVFEGQLLVPEKGWLNLDDLVLKQGDDMTFISADEIPKMNLIANYPQILGHYLTPTPEAQDPDMIRW